VEVIVVCSTSDKLMKSVLDASGLAANDVDKRHCISTTAGHLPCKRIIFSPWISDLKQGLLLEDSIREFVATAVEHAAEAGYNTIAFPAIGKEV
jgi:O-acetyl-ADP-ribose deacetylase (regulator of RNase III)